MRVRITGKLVEVQEEAVILERDGVCWEIMVPRFSLGELAATRGREVTLHTLEFFDGNPSMGSFTPRMVGFLHPEDKAFFLRFVEVKGIGARKALKALGQPVVQIARWIEAAEAKSLATLPGIGKRAADLIIAQLRGKVSDLTLGAETGGISPAASFNRSQRDALGILIAWGDGRTDAERWLERAAQLHPEIDRAEEWVKAAYRVKTGAE